MMHRRTNLLMFALFAALQAATAQGYTSYFTGNATDVVTSPQGGVCLMGGAGEDDNAMAWFLERVDGGDVLVAEDGAPEDEGRHEEEEQAQLGVPRRRGPPGDRQRRW